MSATKTMLILSNTVSTTITLTIQNLISVTFLGWGLPLLLLGAIPTLSLAIQAACSLSNQERNTLTATTCLMGLSSIILYCLPQLSLSHTIITLSIASLLSMQYAMTKPIAQNNKRFEHKDFEHEDVFTHNSPQ